jgi:serine/threonine-protein kinase
MSAFGTPRSPRAQLRAGHRLDNRYELLFPYAQGGMATVWLARVQGKHGFEKLYAVKTILPHLADDAGFRTMFLDEARIASRIRHGNVAEIEDLGECDGHLYMVLEWIQGDAWSKLVAAVSARRDAVPIDLMLRIAAEGCAGLHAAHELTDDVGRSLNVVHRDVSPQNIMVSEAGVVKVIDFGVAKAIGRASEATRTGLIKGKLEYLAPELASGREVGRRADVWAMGATLYEVLAGRAPFTGKTDLEVLRRISSGKPPRPLPSIIPRSVADIVMRSLQSDLDRRIPSALEFQRLLESVMTSPVSREDVADALRHYLAPRIQARHAAIAEALREAAGDVRFRQPDPVPAGFPLLLPEAAELQKAPRLERTDDPDTSDDAATRGGDPITEPFDASRLRPLHAAWIAVATLITLGVWFTVIAQALAR